MKLNNKKGFTIVELVIVIAVIAILAGVLIPTFSTVIENANKSAALQEAKTAMEIVAMEEDASLSGQYFIVTGKYVFVYDAENSGITETKPNNFTKKKTTVVKVAKREEVGIDADVTVTTPDNNGYTQADVVAEIVEALTDTADGKDVYYAASEEAAYDATTDGDTSSALITKDANGKYTVTMTTGTNPTPVKEITFNEDISKNVIVIGFKPVNA